MVVKIRLIQVGLTILVYVGASGVDKERSYEGLKMFVFLYVFFFLETFLRNKEDYKGFCSFLTPIR